MTCSKCHRETGALAITATAWAGDTEQGTATWCMVCAGFLTSPTFMPDLYRDATPDG